MSMRSIAVVNQKGGCGKTITAINVSAFLAKQQRRVLLIDMDPQGHATLGLQTDPAQPGRTISEVLLRESNREGPSLRDIRRAILPGLDLVPADIMLSAVSEKLSAVPGREYRLTEALAEVHGQYHYILVDCPPNVGLLTFNALMACSETIIPLDPSFFSLHGIGKLLETLDVLARRTGHDIEPRALITLYTGRADFVKEVVADIRKHLPDRVFDTLVRFSVKLAEAASHGIPIVEYCRRCVGYEDYQMVTAEILRQEARRPCPCAIRTHSDNRGRSFYACGAGGAPCAGSGRLQLLGTGGQRDGVQQRSVAEDHLVSARQIPISLCRGWELEDGSVESQG
jgi:chromosome partitioning protein